MERKTVVYLAKPGPRECAACLKAAAERAVELSARHAVVATSSGQTALALAKALRAAGSEAQVVGVGFAADFAAKWGRHQPRFTTPARKLGAVFIGGTHALSGVNGAVQGKFGNCVTPGNLIANTYYTFSQGLKVAVEVALMAADQGAVPTDREILALGGTGQGADTAVVLVPACSEEFFNLRIREVVCMPR